MGLAAFNRMRRQNAEKAEREVQPAPKEGDNVTPAQAKQAVAKAKTKKQAKQAE